MSDPLLHQSLRLLRRELRGGLHGFGVFLTCLFLGVFAIAAIGSFSAAARAGLLADASALLGGDLEIRLAHRPATPAQQQFISSRGELSKVRELRSMAASADGGERALVEVKAVDGAYPLYGRLAIAPEQSVAAALAATQDGFGALVEESLLQRLKLAVGDRLRLGDSLLTISGVLLAEPDRTIRAFHLGPRLLISEQALEATGLLQPGSLVNYGYRLRLADREQAEPLMAELRQAFPDAGWRLQSWRQATPRVRYFLDRMSTNLSLFGLCALLVGGLGVSGAVRGYLEQKLPHMATMKCLGASSRLIFTTYLMQVLLLGALGAGVALIAGGAVPYLLKAFGGPALPLPLQPALFPGVLATAALFGLLTALLFSLKPLGSACRVPPASLFRGYVASDGQKPGRAIWLLMLLTALLLGLLAIISSSDRKLAAGFLLGALLCFLLFRLLAALVVKLARRLPRPADPRLRLGLANIHRPGAPAPRILFSLGLGLTALVMTALVQANLNDMVRQTIPAEAPAFFFLDIQPDQVAAFEAALHAEPPLLKLERYPTLRGRITAIKGIPVEQTQIAPEVQWAVRGDRFFSYSGQMPQQTALVAGNWWPADYRGAPLLSLTADLAKGFGVGLGDRLSVNILGREFEAEIASLREVDWSTLELNFALLFSPGILESAPQTHIAAVHVAPGGEEQIYRAVTDRFGNISAISTREVLQNVTRTLERIGGAFSGMAGIALLSGFLVLAGAIAADQHRRIHDAVIFKVCGATRGDILLSFAGEFALLGLLAGGMSALAGGLAAFAILKGPLDAPFNLHPEVILLTLAAGVGSALFLGLLGTWKALGHKPARYLRDE